MSDFFYIFIKYSLSEEKDAILARLPRYSGRYNDSCKVTISWLPQWEDETVTRIQASKQTQSFIII